MSRNRLGISSFVLASPFGDADLAWFSRVREMGYELVEVCVEDPGLLSAEKVRAAAAAAGVRLSVGGVFGRGRDISHRSPRWRQTGLNYLLWCVEFAAAVGASVVSGPMYSAAGKARMLSASDRETQRGWAVEGVRTAAAHAGDRGVTLAIEPLNRFETDLVNTVEQGVQFCERVDRDNVGLTLDTFHLGIEEKQIGEAIRAAGRFLRSFQASENDRGAPGSGHIPWAEVFDALDDVGYDGPIVVESFRPDVAAVASGVCLWRPVAASMDQLARDSHRFLTSQLERSPNRGSDN